MSYTVWLSNSLGNRIKPLPFKALEYGKAVNDIGSLSLTLSKSAVDSRIFGRDIRLEVWRKTNKGRTYLDMGTTWLIQEYVESYGLGAQYTFNAVCPNHILARRAVAYSSDTTQAKKTGAVDWLLYSIVSENMGTGATDVARRISDQYFRLQEVASTGPVITDYACSQREILATLQDLCSISASKGTPLFFDVIARDAMLEFGIFAGVRNIDRTGRGVLFSPELKTLYNATVITSYLNEITHAYVLGQGQGGGRLIGEYTDSTRAAASPFNRREVIEEGRKATTEAGLNDEAAGIVREGAPRKTITGEIQDTPTTSYGDDWELGDLVIAQAGKDRFNCHISAVSVSVSEGKEKVAAKLMSVL